MKKCSIEIIRPELKHTPDLVCALVRPLADNITDRRKPKPGNRWKRKLYRVYPRGMRPQSCK